MAPCPTRRRPQRQQPKQDTKVSPSRRGLSGARPSCSMPTSTSCASGASARKMSRNELTRFEAALLRDPAADHHHSQPDGVGSIGESDASIFDAHILSLEDSSLIESVKEQVFSRLVNVDFAYEQCGAGLHPQDAANSTTIISASGRPISSRRLASRAAQSSGQGAVGPADDGCAIHRPGPRSVALRHGRLRPQARARHRHRSRQPYLALGHHGALAQPACGRGHQGAGTHRGGRRGARRWLRGPFHHRAERADQGRLRRTRARTRCRRRQA